MNGLEIGAKLKTLNCTDESITAIKLCIGKKIQFIKLTDGDLTICFYDKTRLKLWDNGEVCCGDRYFRTDDTLADYFGDHLLGFEIRDAPDRDDQKDNSHEVQFLVMNTNQGQLVLSSHNLHNGYYGGFAIQATTSVK